MYKLNFAFQKRFLCKSLGVYTQWSLKTRGFHIKKYSVNENLNGFKWN